jgi:hypothetical protein
VQRSGGEPALSPVVVVSVIPGPFGEGRWPAGDVVNGFVNETRRNASDGVRRGEMARTGDSVVACAFETGEATRDGDRLAHNPEVAGSNPVPTTKKVALTRPNGRQHQLAAVSF